MLELAQHIQAYLHKHDRPPVSLYEEMMLRKREEERKEQERKEKERQLSRMKEEEQVGRLRREDFVNNMHCVVLSIQCLRRVYYYDCARALFAPIINLRSLVFTVLCLHLM